MHWGTHGPRGRGHARVHRVVDAREDEARGHLRRGLGLGLGLRLGMKCIGERTGPGGEAMHACTAWSMLVRMKRAGTSAEGGGRSTCHLTAPSNAFTWSTVWLEPLSRSSGGRSAVSSSSGTPACHKFALGVSVRFQLGPKIQQGFQEGPYNSKWDFNRVP
jgi:hypothetical protein